MVSDGRPPWPQPLSLQLPPVPETPPGPASPSKDSPFAKRKNKDRRVGESADLFRIAALPTRTWSVEGGEAFADKMTEILRKPWGTMRLRPIQAIGLFELAEYGGLFGPLRVGAGKTLLSLLAPTVLQWRLNAGFRPLLVVPASLVEKTQRDHRQLIQHWHITESLKVVSYESLGRVKAAEFLQEYVPDLIILDECHRVRNTKASVTRRFMRYFREVGKIDLSHKHVYCAAFSGTVTKRSIQDYSHILGWCFSPDRKPQPLHFEEMFDWADALDNLKGGNIDPGELRLLCNDEESRLWETNPTRAARQTYRRRLVETPGIVATTESPIDASLFIRAAKPQPSAIRDAAFHTLRTKHETPDGFALADTLEVFRHVREIALGFFYVRVDGKCLDVLEMARQVLQAQPGLSTDDLVCTVFAAGVVRAGREIVDSALAKFELEKRRARGHRDAVFTHALTDPNTLPKQCFDTFREFCDIVQLIFKPPEWWLTPRRLWAKFVREKIKHSRKLDSEYQVRLWVASLEPKDEDDVAAKKFLDDWESVQKQFEPATHPCWLDESVINFIADWAQSHKGIVWVEHRCVGERLSRDFGLRYYSNEGLDGYGNFIDDHADECSFVASIASNKEGRNLQRWCENMIVSPPTTGLAWEQCLGRTHRDGQQADEVTVDLVVSCIEHYLHFCKALSDAEYSEDTLGSSQKLLVAARDFDEHTFWGTGPSWGGGKVLPKADLERKLEREEHEETF